MLADVKKCAEAHDIKGLRYIFVDSLDVDPTFEKYRAGYEYCKSIPEFFDDYQALNEITTDSKKWTDQYWDQLKLDLMKNFSQKRFEHMISVARIVYADKITRLLNERDEEKARSHTVAGANEDLKRKDFVRSENAIHAQRSTIPAATANSLSDEEIQKRRLEEKRRELAEYNRKIEEEEAAKAARREIARQESLSRRNVQSGGNGLKKVMGTVLVIIVIVVVVLVMKALL